MKTSSRYLMVPMLIVQYLLSLPVPTHAFPSLSSLSSRAYLNPQIKGWTAPTKPAAATSTKSRTVTTKYEYDIEELSRDPKCVLIHNFLPARECRTYIARADATHPESMTRSNAPAVSLRMERLWPLPFLCLGAGVPTVVRSLLRDTDRLYYSEEGGLTVDYCVHLLSIALPPIAVALGVTTLLIMVVQTLVAMYARRSSRTSVSLALNTEDDCNFIRTLVDRACDVTNRTWTTFEAPVITKYPEGAAFASHNDASPTKGSEWSDAGGQRVVTVLVYLNTCQEGGETKFDRLGFKVRPNEGSALIFYPADAETLEADGRTGGRCISLCPPWTRSISCSCSVDMDAFRVLWVYRPAIQELSAKVI